MPVSREIEIGTVRIARTAKCVIHAVNRLLEVEFVFCHAPREKGEICSGGAFPLLCRRGVSHGTVIEKRLRKCRTDGVACRIPPRVCCQGVHGDIFFGQNGEQRFLRTEMAREIDECDGFSCGQHLIDCGGRGRA